MSQAQNAIGAIQVPEQVQKHIEYLQKKLEDQNPKIRFDLIRIVVEKLEVKEPEKIVDYAEVLFDYVKNGK